MSVTLCTLFEGDYHLGAAALLNSLHRSGFNGTFVCGYRGARPAWAGQTASLAPVKVRWVEVTSPIHLTNYKPVFMRSCLHVHTPETKAVGYLDPDIVVKASWAVMERWIQSDGVALCEDVNASFPAGHPYRFAWNDFFTRHKLTPVRTLDRYYNAGFVAVNRKHENLLACWEKLIELAGQELGSLRQLKHSGPESLFSHPGSGRIEHGPSAGTDRDPRVGSGGNGFPARRPSAFRTPPAEASRGAVDFFAKRSQAVRPAPRTNSFTGMRVRP